MQDPYSILGVSPSATDDEVKKAYRALALKYHPDRNKAADAETRMKEINAAYTQVTKMRRDGASGYGSSGYGSSGYGSSGYSSSGYGSSGYGSSGYGSYGYGSSGYGSSGYGSYAGGQSSGDARFNAVRSYIQAGRYQEALNALNNFSERSAEWYYLSARANLGLGNSVAALNYARQAVNMNPNNMEYRILLSQLEGRSSNYQECGAPYNAKGSICRDPLTTCCLLSTLCTCFSGSCFCPCGCYR